MNRIAIAIAILCTVNNARAAWAEETASNPLFNVELFSLSKHTEDAFDAPAAVYIITAEDIRRSGATTIVDTLRMVPGLQIAQQNAYTTTVSSRGFGFQFANKLLVMVDGRVVYKPLFSGTFWDMQDTPLENIDRIEVIRGPGGTIWGSNAVNGIINIITKKASVTLGNQASLEVSNHRDVIANMTHGASLDNGGNYRIYAHQTYRASELTTAGKDAKDQSELSDTGFRYDISHPGKDTFTLEGEVKSEEAHSYFTYFPTLTAPYATSNPHDKSQQSANLLAKLEHQIDSESSLDTQAYVDFDNMRTGVVDWTLVTLDGEVQYNWRPDKINQITSGVGIRGTFDEAGNPDNPWDVYRHSTRTDMLYSVFAQDKLRLIPDLLFFTAGTKLENNGYSGFEVEPSARLTCYPSESQTLWAAISRAVRTPSRGETDAMIRLVGTPAGYISRNFEDGYSSEDLIAYEIGYRVIPYSPLMIEGTVFYNSYTNLRTLELGPPIGNISSPYGTRNNGYGETHGVELDTKYQVRKDWRLQASVSFIQMDLQLKPGAVDPTFLVQEKQTPKYSYSLNSFYNITPTIEFDNSLYYVGNIVGLTAIQPIKAYTRLDSRLGWHIRENIEVSLIGQNLLTGAHQEFSPTLYGVPEKIERTVLAKISVKF